jgi:membrane carboxypeptidase/penicillin-binding protein
VTPLELSAAYAAFANGGKAVRPLWVRWITDAEGNLLQYNEPEAVQVLSPETASLMTHVLQEVVEEGTARNARALGFHGPAAGKTGTSDNETDAWFIGYTPSLVCGVWLGNDRPSSLGRASSHLALPVWVRFMRSAARAYSSEEFSLDPHLVDITVDPETGLRARAGCPSRRKEYFISGTKLPSACTAHAGGLPRLLSRFFHWFRQKPETPPLPTLESGVPR